VQRRAARKAAEARLTALRAQEAAFFRRRAQKKAEIAGIILEAFHLDLAGRPAGQKVTGFTICDRTAKLLNCLTACEDSVKHACYIGSFAEFCVDVSCGKARIGSLSSVSSLRTSELLYK